LYRFEEQDASGSRSFFTEIIASVSDIKFARDGRHILSRDYMTLKVCSGLISHLLSFLVFTLNMNFVKVAKNINLSTGYLKRLSKCLPSTVLLNLPRS
jgi:hypothetical protein